LVLMLREDLTGVKETKLAIEIPAAATRGK
jgi:hypothetical protein